MRLTEKRIKEFQKIYEKKEGKKISWKEVTEAAYNLAGFIEVIFNSWVEDQHRKKKLEKYPKGFHLEGEGYTCHICRSSISNEETWYDKYGIKCLICQKAINKKIIPASVAKTEDIWYSAYDLKDRFNIDHHAMKRFIKEGILKPRIILDEFKKTYCYLFLLKDNKDVLPPKKLTESQLIREKGKDGGNWHHLEPWYKFVDPHKALKEYKIMDYLRVIR